ncbi:Ig-like domain-containing protein [Variovorax sp. YR752]|uniref:Ig-like domain-containing protein n=1 Tax=Variovorax sp. YR752 TaxID=1884383 RepID=UPI003137F002
MATKKKTKVVVNSNGRNIDHTVDAAASGKAPLKIKVGNGAKYLLKGEDGFAPENVTLTRVGEDLHVTLEGETSPGLVLEGYYAQSEPVGLYGVAEDGQLYAYTGTDATSEVFSLAEGQSTAVALGGDSLGSGVPYMAGAEAGAGNDLLGGLFPLLITGGLAALGMGLIAAGSGSDGDPGFVGPVAPEPQPPGKPGFDSLSAYDDVGKVTGPIPHNGKTDDTRPDFSGVGATPGNTITIYDGGKEIGKVVVDGNGNWSLTPSKDLGEGKHSITITESDAVGREGLPSDPLVFEVDTTAPPAPGWNGQGIGDVIDNVGTVTGSVPPGGATDDQRPEFKGEGTPGHTINVYDDETLLGSVQVGEDGKWTFTPPADLIEGEHAITITETDTAGNESQPSKPFEFDVDLSAPTRPEVGGAIDNVGEITGEILPGGVTDDRQPELHGKGEPGGTIVIEDNGTEIGTVDVDEDGNWSFIPPEALDEGEHSIVIVERDPAGNESKPSDPFDFVVDITPPDPSKLAITGVEEDVGAIKGHIASGGTTDDSHPVVSGTGTAGDTIIVSVKDVTGEREVGRTTVDAEGNWSLPVDKALLSGPNEFTAVEMDPAGNKTAPSAPYDVTVDLATPPAPVIQNVQDDVGPNTGMLQKGELTDDAQPTIIGTAQAGATVKVYDGTTLLGQVVADATGKWSLTPETALADGRHDITATATNTVGQTSAPTGVWHFTVDATAPGQVTDFEVTDDVGGTVGKLTEGMTTDDDRPTFSGKAEPGATVTVYDNGEKIGEALAGPDGQWSLTPDKPLPSGEHAFTTEVVDPAGNGSGQSDPLNVIVDAIPGVVTLDTLVDDEGAIRGTIAANGSTDDTRPEIQGTGKAGSTVHVYDGVTLLGETVVKGDGTWSFTPTTPLADGAHAITVTATSLAGNTSEPTPAVNFTVDTLAPTAPSIDAAEDDVGAKQGALVNGGVTDDPSPTLSGKAEAGSTVAVYDNGKLLGTVPADAAGHWTYTPTTPLAEGEHTFTVTATDKAGNTGAPSAGFVLTTDFTPPDATKLAITGVEDDVGNVLGNIASGGKTDDSSPVIHGTGTAGNTVIVMIKDGLGERELGRATVGEDGTWSLEPKHPLVSGSNSFTAIEMDAAGNPTAPSTSYEVIVDVTKPEPPVIENVQDDVGPSKGMLQKNELTDDARPTITGTAQPGSTVTLYDKGVEIGKVPADAAGRWSFTPEAALADGTHDITATASSTLGQTSEPTGVWSFAVDTQPPGKVTGLEVLDNVGDKTGALVHNDITDDNTPTFNGKAEPGSTVKVYDNGMLLGTAPVGPDGNWTFTPGTPLPDGAHSFTTEVIDPAGNASGKSDPLNVTVNTQDVLVSIDTLVDDQGTLKGVIAPGGVTDDTRPEIKGTGKVDSTIHVYDGEGEGKTLLGTTLVGADGKWSFTPTADLSQGEHKITATATDLSSNVSKPTPVVGFTVDTAAPTAPTIVSAEDDVGAKQGALVNGGVTDDPSPTLSGQAEAGSTVTVYDNGKLLGTAPVDAAGHWAYTPTTPLNEGTHSFTVTATDKAGNTSAPSAGFVLTTDFTPPAASAAVLSDNVGAVQGEIASGGITDDDTPTYAGKSEPNATVVIYNEGKEIGRVPTDEAGNWRFTPAPLDNGSYSFSHAVIDAAGNAGARGPATDFTVASTPPVIRIDGASDDVGKIIGAIAQGGVTDDATPTLTGKATANGTVKVYDGATLLGQTTADANGNWTFTPDTALVEGLYTLSATVTTPANGESAPTEVFELTVDLSPPSKPAIDAISDDVGSIKGPIANGGITDDATPTLSGKGEPGTTMQVFDNGVLLDTVDVDSKGDWSFTPAPPLAIGEHNFSVVNEDKAGNPSEHSEAYTVIVDTSPWPGQPTIDTVYDDQGAIKGNLNPGDTTDDAKPLLSGKSEPNSVVILKDGGIEIGRAPVDADGNWHFEPLLPLGNGAHSITVTAVDTGGNVGATSDSFGFDVIGGGAPAVPAITAVNDDVGASKGGLQKEAVTDDARPTIVGTAEIGATVSLYSNGKLLGTVVADATGNWTFTPSNDLADGLHNITADATNAAGNPSPKTGDYPITVDTVAPGASSAVLSDDVGSIKGPITSGDITDDSTPTFSGKTEPNATVVVYDDGKEIGRVPADAQGNWSFTPNTPLADGEHSFSNAVIDPAGNVGEKGAAIDFTVNTAGVTVTLDGASDNVGTITGAIAKGGVTDDATPTLTGKATANGIVKVYDGDTLVGQTTADANGNWSVTPGTALGEGQHQLTATVTTTATGESARTEAFALTVDLSAPSKLAIDAVKDDVGGIQGPIANGGSTDDTTPTLSGKGEPGTTVQVFDNGSLLGTADVDSKGDWNFTPTTPLNNGEHSFTVVNEDKAGNLSEPSAPHVVVVDTVAPGQPTIDSVYDDQGAVKGDLSPGGITDDAKPLVSGKAEPNSTVVIKDGAIELGRAPVDANGNWSFEPLLPLGSGLHNLTATAVDAAGNTGAASDGFGFKVIGDENPQPPTIVSVNDNAGSIVGDLQKNAVTDDATPTVSGTGEVGATISVYSNDVLLGTTLVQGDGTWVFTPPAALAEGLNNLAATATNLAGNTSDKTGVYPVTVDTTAPTAGTAVLSDDAGDIVGPITSGSTIDDSTPTYTGKTEPNATVVIYDHGSEIGRVPADAEGNWKFTPTTPLVDGAHELAHAVIDVAGNLGARSPAIDFTLDTRDVTVSITGAEDNAGTVTGAIAKGGVTDDTTPTLSGKATAGGTVKIYNGGVLLGEVVADANDNWSFTPSPALGDGLYTLTATVTTDAGGESKPTPVFDLTVDTLAPAKPTIEKVEDDVGDLRGPLAHGASTDDFTPTLSGKAEANSTVYIYSDGGNLLGKVPADAAGNWSFTTTQLNSGTYDFTVVSEDKAGNRSEPSNPWQLTVDLTPPAVPTIVTVVDNVGPLTTDLTQGGLTDDTRPEFKGKAEAGSTVKVYDGATLLGTVVADAGGNWACTPGTALGDGAHSVTVTATDAAGNTSAPSASFDFTVDATAPAKPTLVSVTDDVGSILGNVALNGTTDDPRPEFKGTAEAGSTVVIYDKGVELIRVQADASGNWTYTPDTALSNSTHSITVTAVDTAGNTSAPSDAFGFTVLTTPPPRPTIVTVTDDVGATKGEMYSGDFTDDSRPFFVGKAEANSTVIILDNGVEVIRVKADASGNWTYTPDAPLADGGHSISAVAMNQAGTTSVPSAAFGFTVDTTAPVAPTSVTVDVRGEKVAVTLADTKLKVGDSLDIVSNGKHLQHTLTQADIDAQSVTVALPADMTSSVVVGVIDQAGNVSGYRTTTPLGSEFLSGSAFTQRHVTPTGVYLGTSSVKVYSEQKIGDLSESLWLGAAVTHYRTDFLLDEPATRIQFRFGAESSMQPMYVAFFDAAGVEVGRLNYHGTTNHLNGDVDFEAPLGKGIASFSFVTPGGDGNGTTIPALTITRPGGTSQVLPPEEVLDTRADSQIYHGGEEANSFNGTDGADSDVEGSEIHGEGGPDTAATFNSTGLQVDADATLVHAGYRVDGLSHATQTIAEADETLIARLGFADRLEGGAGNDTFTNVGTGDVVQGGAGNDIVHVIGGDFERLDGGLGIDTLVMDGKAMHIDLSALGLAKVQGFEKFDLGAGGNTLALSTSDVLAGGARDMVTADGKVQMLVNGANGEVDLLGGHDGGDGWMQGSNATVGGVTYSVYTNLAGTAELLVEDKVHVTIL